MIQNREENRVPLTLCDFVNFSSSTEENASVIHNSASRVKINHPLKCSYKSNKKRTAITIFRGKNQLPIVGLKCKQTQKTQNSRVSEDAVPSKINSRPLTHQKMNRSELTRCSNQTPNTSQASFNPLRIAEVRYSSFESETAKTPRPKGYQAKNIRLIKERNDMREMFRNYQRFNGVRLDSSLKEELRREVIRKEEKRFVLLRNI